MAKRKNVHVEPADGGWAVKEGSSKSVGSYASKADAIKAGREIARKNGSEHIIHRRDGRIEEQDSYGTDPFPPAKG